MNQVIISYPPGSNWLYLRIYGGPLALEEWLTGSFRDLLMGWIGSGTVNQFHFVRYLDPDYHLRLRFKLSDPGQAGLLLTIIYSDCRNWIEEERIWKIEAGTYEPEIDRYGMGRINLVEEWFYRDSLFWLAILAELREDDQPAIWKTGAQHIDWMLDQFAFEPEGKHLLLQRMREALSAEFRITHRMKSQLDAKYRMMSRELADTLEKPQFVEHCGTPAQAPGSPVIGLITHTFSSRHELEAAGFLPDLIHMSLNRAFRSRQRLQELVLYDFMARYYASAVARKK